MEPLGMRENSTEELLEALEKCLTAEKREMGIPL